MHEPIPSPASAIGDTTSTIAHPPATTRLAIVRHGETDWNRRGLLQGRVDQPLNTTGRAQAADAAESLAGRAWDLVVSSPLDRAATTAGIIAELLGLATPALAPEFTEQSFGVAEGTPAQTAFTTWPGGDYPDGERRAEVDARVATGLERILAEHHGRSIVLVCHVIVVRSIMLTLTGNEPAEVPNGSATILTHVEGREGWS